ncbi:MAG: ABC transporter permease, partial [Saprospiraceae bacterium]|nr:ABC transporter permease [Saprospiraceae bacterium]
MIFRNPTILRMIIAMPVVQLIVIPFAADYEVKNINFSVVDADQSMYSQRLIQKLDASDYFSLVDCSLDEKAILQQVDRSETDLMITIPSGFEKDLVSGQHGKIFLEADAVNGIKAGLGTAYAAQIINQFNQEIREEWIPVMPRGAIPVIQIQTASWYNPLYNYHWFMVPGILAILVTMVGSFLSALNIVSEKEGGTIEQLNVTPIKKGQFILGKLIPFWILGLVSVTISMVVGVVIYGLWPAGSILSVLFYAAIYLLAVLGIGLLISTLVESQQQATLIAFFIMLMFILMGGLYTPIESMP